MLREQPYPLPNASPEGIKYSDTPFDSSLVHLHEPAVQEHLIAEYNLYRNKLKRLSCLGRLVSRINQLCTACSAFCQQLWAELIPEALRGDRQQVQIVSNKDQSFFEEYAKKKSRFFLIVYDDTCQQEEMLEAFEKSTIIAMEGRGIRLSELPKETNSSHWKIKSLSEIQKYTIFFFKYDMFGHLLTFGHLSKPLIDSHQHDPHFLQQFKREIDQVYEKYEQIEKDFSSSYLEKEDRVAFE